MGCFYYVERNTEQEYTGEFKQLVVETMMREKLGYREAARQFEIPDYKDIAKWERYYLSKGLYIERRGCDEKGQLTTFSVALSARV